MQIFVHDLGNDIQSAGGGIAIKKNAESNADDQNIAEYIQFLAVGHGTKIREDFFEYSKKDREHDAGVNCFYSEFLATGDKSNDQEYNVQNHGDRRQWQWYKV